MGELGISLGDPDDWALDVLGNILNSFGGRLFDRIRSKEVHSLDILSNSIHDWLGRSTENVQDNAIMTEKNQRADRSQSGLSVISLVPCCLMWQSWSFGTP